MEILVKGRVRVRKGPDLMHIECAGTTHIPGVGTLDIEKIDLVFERKDQVRAMAAELSRLAS